MKRLAFTNTHTLGFEVIVDERYEVTHMIGSGAYGVVWSAFDKVNKEEVAIKKI